METLFFHSAPAKKRRVTVAAVVTDDGIINIGVAKCSALDAFSKRKGRSIASVRANTAGRYATYTVDDVPNEVGIGRWFRTLAQDIVKEVMTKKSPLHAVRETANVEV